MLRLIIVENDEYSNYELEDIKGSRYSLNINFIGVLKPEIGTEVYIEESVIKENVSLNYGLVDKKMKIKENELIVLSYNKDKVYLQRFYG